MLGGWAARVFHMGDARFAKSPIAQEVVRRIDELFAIEAHLPQQHAKLSPKHDLAKPSRPILISAVNRSQNVAAVPGVVPRRLEFRQNSRQINNLRK